ncbi:MAG: associated domain protein, partial [Deltaproteobacteria bacterium]|nr:associated domain protein [Deltaproteobacteria bacterium]
RTFDFELQASATDDGIVISLGQPHSFALETVFGFVTSEIAEDTLIQALLDRPMFEIRWRWNVTRALTVLRRRAGKKVPPHLIKMRAADTLSVVFPQAQACPENLPGSMPGMPGNREIPDHPLVFETIRDCLVEAMDLAGLREMLGELERGEIQVMARDTVEPSPLSHELINANPYAFLDDAPLEERRTRAVSLRRGLPATILSGGASDQVGVLDDAAIASASEEVAPVVRDADELHDALLGLWLVPEPMGLALAPEAGPWFEALAMTGRACRVSWEQGGEPQLAWVATERLGAARAVLGEAVACVPAIATPSWAIRPEREEAITKLAGAHLDHRGPVSTRALAAELGLPILDVLLALLALEADGAIMRGSFTSSSPGSATSRHASTTVREALAAADDPAALHDLEWCNRRVLARIHRLTLTRLRKEIEPVSAAALMRFLLRWQRVSRNTQLIGADGLGRIVEQLQGFETASGAWEREVLPARLCNYDPTWLDQMCLAGQVVWCRLSPRRPTPESAEAVDEAAAAEPAIAGQVSPQAGEVITSRVTATAMQRAALGVHHSTMRLASSPVAPKRSVASDPGNGIPSSRHRMLAGRGAHDPYALPVRPPEARTTRNAPSRSAPLALMLRRDVTWLRAAAAITQGEPATLGAAALRIRDHLAQAGASFLPDLVAMIDLPPDEIEEALWELVGAGLATADGFASLRVLVSRRRGEVKSHFDRTTVAAPTVRKWQDAIRKARTHDRSRPGHALRSLPTAAGRWSLLPTAVPDAIDVEASARQLLVRYGVVFRDLLARESSLPPWRDLLVALRRLEARGEIRGGRFVTGFVGEQFALPEALDELRGARHGGAGEVCRVAATDPLNLVGVLSPGPRVSATVGNAVLYLDGQPVASLEAGAVVQRAPIPSGARIDDDLTYHPPPRPLVVAAQAALPL